MEWFLTSVQSLRQRRPRIITLMLASLVSIFLVATVFSHPAEAATVWKGQSISHNDEIHNRLGGDQRSALQLPAEVPVYGLTKEEGGEKLLQTIQLPANTTQGSPVTAKLVIYRITPPNNYTQVSSADISVQTDAAGTESGASCQVEHVGWMVCGPSTWVAGFMDWGYSQLAGLMKTPAPKQSDPRDSIMMSWQIMRGIANAAFVVAFLVIIYSHITSVGLSNYGMKKMLPRLIIAALAVNLSLVVCIVFIDISNILGVALQDMFTAIRDQLVANSVANGTPQWNWADVTALVLSGTGAGVGLYAGALAVNGSVTALAPLLVPVLLMVLLALVVVFLVLAARQAIIVILVIISPLAFVLYLLPGTEKWFEKWRDTLFTMLFFFPAFSVIFGGAQLAGTVIIANASSVIMLILGLAVQIAPLAIAPIVMKLGGGLLNRFAGVVNNPSRGLIDRSKQWAEQRSKHRALKQLDAANNHKGLRGSFRRGVQYFDHRNRALKDRIADYEKRAENSYHGSRRYKELDLQARRTNEIASVLEQEASNRYDGVKAGHYPTDLGPRPSLGRHMPWVGDRIEAAHQQRADKRAQAVVDDAKMLAERVAAAGIQKTIAQRMINQDVAKSMETNAELLEMAAGLYGDIGKNIALANAVATTRSEFGKSAEEAQELMNHFKVDSGQRQKIAKGIDVSIKDSSGRVVYTFKPNENEPAREVAIEQQIMNGTVDEVTELIELSGAGEMLADFRGTISSAVAKSGIRNKAPFLGGRMINEIIMGNIKGHEGVMNYINGWVQEGKYKPADIAGMDLYALKKLDEAIGEAGSARWNAIDADTRAGLRSQIHTVLNDPQLSANVADNARGKLEEMYARLA